VYTSPDSELKIQRAGITIEEFLMDNLNEFLQTQRPHPKVLEITFDDTGETVFMVRFNPRSDVWVATSKEEISNIFLSLVAGDTIQ